MVLGFVGPRGPVELSSSLVGRVKTPIYDPKLLSLSFNLECEGRISNRFHIHNPPEILKEDTRVRIYIPEEASRPSEVVGYEELDDNGNKVSYVSTNSDYRFVEI